METTVKQVGSSVGVIIPQYIASEGGFHKGTPINIRYVNNQIIIDKPTGKRRGWSEAFARFAQEGEDEMLLPEYLDSETDELL